MKLAFEEMSTINDPKQLEHSIDALKSDVKELEVLIEEMLQYSKLNQVKDLITSPVKVKELISNLVSSVSAYNIKIDILFKLKDPNIQIYADEHSLLRAFSNILRNAISFSEQICQIKVFENPLNCVIIEIIDDGPGLAEKNLQNIFEPFIKITSAKRSAGHGLGLSIAKKIIRKHGGKITVFNNADKGACFQISLPRVQ
jgi:signal transduction histidine kinase